MAPPRMRRVNEAMREVLSSHIAGDLKDPRIGFVTVTSVQTSPDLSTARVFVSVFGDEDERYAAIAGLTSSRGILQGHVARELRLKRTPMLTFIEDDTAMRATRIEQLIHEIAPEDREEGV